MMHVLNSMTYLTDKMNTICFSERIIFIRNLYKQFSSIQILHENHYWCHVSITINIFDDVFMWQWLQNADFFFSTFFVGPFSCFLEFCSIVLLRFQILDKIHHSKATFTQFTRKRNFTTVNKKFIFREIKLSTFCILWKLYWNVFLISLNLDLNSFKSLLMSIIHAEFDWLYKTVSNYYE